MSPKTVQKKHTFLETKIKNKFLPKVCRKRSLCDVNDGFSKSRLCSLCSPQKLKASTKAPFSKASLQRPLFCGQLLGSLLVWLCQRKNLQSISVVSLQTMAHITNTGALHHGNELKAVHSARYVFANNTFLYYYKIFCNNFVVQKLLYKLLYKKICSTKFVLQNFCIIAKKILQSCYVLASDSTVSKYQKSNISEWVMRKICKLRKLFPLT